MLSKKMTFSLMSLITLLALTFAVPSAIAAFGVTSLTADDVSFAGETQIEAIETGAVTVYLTVDHVVTLGAVQAAFGYGDATNGERIWYNSVVDIFNYHGAIIDDAAGNDYYC